MSKLQSALDLARRGFRVFPLSAGTKVPIKDLAWKQAATVDELTIRRWWEHMPDANIGVATGSVTVIDLDVKEGKDAVTEATLMELDFETLRVRTAGGGLHLYYADQGLGNRVRINGKASAVDVRGQDGYVVGPGSVVDGNAYELENDAPLKSLPADVVRKIGEAPVRSKADRESGSDSPMACAAAAEYLRHRAPLAVEGQGGDHTTFAVAAAVRDYGVSEETALDLLLEEWNDRCSPPWEAGELEVKIANAYRYSQAEKPPLDPAAALVGLDSLTPPPPPVVPETPGLKFFDVRAARDLPPTDWLVHRVLPRVGLACIYGPSGSGKSLVLADLLLTVAGGSKWCGGQVRHTGGSMIFAAEASDTIGPRMIHAGAADDVPVIWADTPAFMAGDDRWQTLIDGIVQARQAMTDRFGEPLRIVAIDTYAAAAIAQEENDNAEASRIQAKLSQIAKAAEVLIILVHHPDKAGNDIRGAGAFRGGLDAAVSVSKSTGGLREVKLTKARGAQERQLGAFTVEESVFYDHEGLRDSVPVLKWAADVDIPDIEPPRVNDVIKTMESLGGTAKLDKALDQFKALVPLTTTAESVFKAGVEYLIKNGRLVQAGWYLKLPQNA